MMPDLSNDFVFVVDDNELYRKFIKTIIERNFKGKVIECTNPKEMFEEFKTNLPILIILDMEMPLMDGYTALKHIRADNSTRDIPVIACTALSSKDLVVRLAQLKISAFIQKNAEAKTIVEKIYQVIRTIKG